MSGEGHDLPQEIDLAAKLWRLVLVTAIFVIVGPPVGGLVAWLGMGAFSFRSPLPFIIEAYSEGILLAFGTGLIVAAAGLWLNMTSWRVPAVATLAIIAIFFVLIAGMDFSQADYLGTLLRLGRVFLPPCFIAAIVCWYLVRRLLQPPQDEGRFGA